MKRIIVEQNTKIDTLSKALSLIDENEEEIEIFIKNGIYKEKNVIKKNNLVIFGEDKEKTIITYDDYANKVNLEDLRDYNTFRTYTLNILSDNVKISNLTISNTASSPNIKGQAVALSVYGNHFVLDNVILSSEQDTLFTGPLPDDLVARYCHFLNKDELFKIGTPYQKYTNCLIIGSVDYIFGTAACLFENCQIHSVKKLNDGGFVAAPAHSLYQDLGYIFHNCHFTCAEDVLENDVYLARPWREFGMATFINCLYGAHIKEIGFEKWKMPCPELFSRLEEYPKVNNRASFTKFLSDKEKDQYLNRIEKEFDF